MLDYKIYEHKSTDEYVVLIHGMGGNASIFYNNLKALKKHFNVLAIHLRGHGKSPSVDQQSDFTIDTAAKEVLQVLDHLLIKKAHFIGISLGTIVIHSIFKMAPKRVCSAVLAGAITHFNHFSKLLVKIGKLIKSFTPFMWIYRLCAHIIMPGKMNIRSRSLFISQAVKMKRADFIAWFNLVDTVEKVYKQVPEKSKGVPKLYISGSDDHLFIKQLQKDIENDEYASFRLIEDCGHVCNVEKSKEFNEVSLEFLINHSDAVKKAQ
ncbi:pimeloyl-ACP methyl ester carboxylesterase [Bacillus ectoiniformans]|uniref:alpha/beta fold hydrolase n=1 Tax=Bacillus ectoiniformans TaxID=1494429 RepID=UPI00195B1CF2|nr:alpha/beta hydrolase [Bacillus ectoiniformans]MBM7649214.1 pimeloyl-ACP methyl ester carboxylesterase [Bacillus ectoiniformans]